MKSTQKLRLTQRLLWPLFAELPPSWDIKVIYPETSGVTVTTSSLGEVLLPDIPPWGECLFLPKVP